MKNKTIGWIFYFLFLVITALLAPTIDMDKWWCVPFCLGVIAEMFFLRFKERED